MTVFVTINFQYPNMLLSSNTGIKWRRHTKEDQNKCGYSICRWIFLVQKSKFAKDYT